MIIVTEREGTSLEKNKIDPTWVEKKRERERIGYKRRKELKSTDV